MYAQIMVKVGHLRPAGMAMVIRLEGSQADIGIIPPMSAVEGIVLKKSFWGDDRNFLEPLMHFARVDAGDHIVSSKNRPWTSVVALKSYAEAERSKDHLSRDFWGCSIFDFCNSIEGRTDMLFSWANFRFRLIPRRAHPYVAFFLGR